MVNGQVLIHYSPFIVFISTQGTFTTQAVCSYIGGRRFSSFTQSHTDDGVSGAV